MPNSPGMEDREAMLAAEEKLLGGRDFSTLTISHAQYQQPWTVPYSAPFRSALKLTPHLMGAHAVLHAQKSVGALAAVFEDLDHSGQDISLEQREELAGKAADLVTAALRLGNLFGFSVARSLVERVEVKNGIDYPAWSGQ